LASGVIALGVYIAKKQITLTKEQATTSFEDDLSHEYRESPRKIPIEALLGGTLDDEAQSKSLLVFDECIDLTNKQVFLWRQGRITPKTRENWCSGIKSNLLRLAFQDAWRTIKSFNELSGTFHKYGDDARGVRDWGFGVRRTNSRTAIFLRESRTPNPGIRHRNYEIPGLRELEESAS